MDENRLSAEQKAKMREVIIEAAKKELKDIAALRDVKRRHGRGNDRG
jgi:hypothetical protein